MNGYYSRDELLQLGFAHVGENVLVSEKASIYGASQMSIGNNVRIDDFCVLVGQIEIGNYVHLAPGVGLHGTGGGKVIIRDYCGFSSNIAVYAGSDDFSGDYMSNPTVPKKYVNTHSADIVFEKHALLGANCVILPGAYIAEGCSIGAMSMLAKPTEPFGVYAGVPCKRIRDRKKGVLKLEQELLAELNK